MLMFIGRERELEILNDIYHTDGFNMLVVYGRRRVGKSYLLRHFFSNIKNNVIAFQAIDYSTTLSIEAFKDAILDVYPSNFDIKLDTWKKCFKYIYECVGEEKVIICIDEINYIFKEDPTFASQLQGIIEDYLQHKNIFLIVCGSNISSIENEVLNNNAPLYGRRNLSIKLQEFDYLTASQFYKNYSNEDKIIAYSIFGGKGKSLAAIDPSKSIKNNIIKQILTPGGTLADEIDLLLKDDFRDPTFYKELLYIMSLGNTTFNDIATNANEDASKVATYLNKLIELKMVEKVEVGNKKNNYRYYIQDNFFSFYFRFIYKRKNILNILIGPEAFYDRFISNDLSSYVGLRFENICEQYIIRQSLNEKLDFIPTTYGKYYGKHKDGTTYDIDVFFKDEDNAICGECKFTNKEFNMDDAKELIDNSKEINVANIYYYVFSKSGIQSDVKKNYPYFNIVTLDDLYND